MTILSRFQLRSIPEYHPSTKNLDPDLPAEGAIHIRELMVITEPADMMVLCKVEDLKYDIYEACPIRKSAKLFCSKKLNDERYCVGCNQTSKDPQYKLYIYMNLQDLNEPELHCHVVAFQPIAEAFLGFTVAKIKKMEAEELAAGLQAKIGLICLFKIRAKKGIKKGYEHIMDLIMLRFRPVSKEEIMEFKEKQQEEETKEERSQPKKSKIKKMPNEEREGEEEEEPMGKKTR